MATRARARATPGCRNPRDTPGPQRPESYICHQRCHPLTIIRNTAGTLIWPFTDASHCITKPSDPIYFSLDRWPGVPGVLIHVPLSGSERMSALVSCMIAHECPTECTMCRTLLFNKKCLARSSRQIITQPKLAVRQTSGQTHTNKSGPCARLSSSPPAARCGTGSPDHFEWFRHRDILRFYDIGLSPPHSMLRRSHTWRAGGQACGAAAGQSRLHGHVPCQVHECGVQYASWFLQSCGVGVAGRMYVSS